ncbi:MAG: hypothetical protein N5P05_001585 [Chroococcopsis gigantea SAG 12.99]|jgi:hypothetical protein|nr:hypothetical protein [Chroococcopsis gigantea SAG 12.99]
MSLNDIGNLMSLSLENITLDTPVEASEFLIKASAKLLIESGGRNWVPVIVTEIEEDRYRVIGNALIYVIAVEAQLSKLWCIIVDDSNQTLDLTRVLTGEVVPKINLSVADRNEIKLALQYLINKGDLKGVGLATATDRIEQASRKSWSSFTPVEKLKCGITKGKKLDSLKQVFYLTPQEEPETLPTGQNSSSENLPDHLNAKTAAQLKQMAKERGLAGYSKLKKSELIALLCTG